MGIDKSFAAAFAKSQIRGGSRLPRAGTVFVSVRDADKPRILEAMRLLKSLGFQGDRHQRNPALPKRAGGAVGKNQQSSGGSSPTSSMPSAMARWLWFSTTRPRGPWRWRTGLGRCAVLPSCIKSPTTPLFQGPSPRRRKCGAWLRRFFEVRALQKLFRRPGVRPGETPEDTPPGGIGFQDKVPGWMAKNKIRACDLQFCPAGRFGGSRE